MVSTSSSSGRSRTRLRAPDEAVEVFVPGRLCVVGEHSDWAAGYRAASRAISPGAAIVVGTEQGILASARRSATKELVFRSGRGRALRAPFADLRKAVSHPFFGPVAGAFAALLERYRCGGVAVEVVRSDLPAGKGLASSAAACVLLVRAARQLHDLPIDAAEEMRLAWEGERRAGSMCGRMDQACALGRACVLLGFDGDDLAVRRLRPGGRFHFVLVDLGGAKDTRRILRDLQGCFPGAPGRRARRCRAALGQHNLAIVARSAAAILAGDAPELGRCLDEAQRIFERDVAPVSPRVLREPRLRALLGVPFVREASLGAKGTGSHGDCCAQVLVRDAASQQALIRRISDDLRLRALPLSLG
jgi:galactokinase